MVKKDYSLLTIVIVVLVVAVISSIITANITGNIIKVKKVKKGTEVYTKEEIDYKLSNLLVDSLNVNNDTLIKGNLIVGNDEESPKFVAEFLGSMLVSNVLFVERAIEVEEIYSGLTGNLSTKPNAYVCVDLRGKFFRSLTPCV